jgi:hypothetical protein
MNKIILQPAGDGDASQHYVDTIENPVDISRIKRFIREDEYNILAKYYRDGKIPVWGVTPGKDDVNYRKWGRIERGDTALFSRQGRIFASAVVTLTTHSKELALDLWNQNSEGETWEYVYFLDEVKNQNIPYAEFNRVAQYEPNNIIQGFNVLYEDKSRLIIEALGLENIIYLPTVSEVDFENAVNDLENLESLDTEGKAKRRVEQSFLRNQLFEGNIYAECGICNKEYPVSFLVAAHIKKRSVCTLEEKKDKSIVMPMCGFGCDELYENGYISVQESKVVQIKEEPITPLVQGYIDTIEGNECKYWNENTFEYFNWHYNHHSE